jgi:hypothetical protein
VYYSALPFAPTNSALYQKYHDSELFPSISGGWSLNTPTRDRLSWVNLVVNSIAFSPDGTRVFTRRMRSSSVTAWDAVSGTQLPVKLNYVHPLNTASHRTIEVNSDGWLTHVPTGQTICKLPSMISPYFSASYDKSFAMASRAGPVIIINFPQVVFMSLDTRVPEGKRGRIHDSVFNAEWALFNH